MAVYQGNTGPDSFRGETTDDSIYGRQGNDTLIGGGGNDLIYGGMGDDQVSVGAASGTNYHSTAYGSEGADTVRSLGGVNTIMGGTGISSIDPNDEGDFIFATSDGAGDLILGNGGADTILGSFSIGGGSFGAPRSTTLISGGLGSDFITYGVRIDSGLTSPDLNDVIDSPALLLGNQGEDTILSTSSQATAYGGQGDDFIVLALGNDLVLGGEGADTIIAEDDKDCTIFGGTGVSSMDSNSVDGSDLIVVGALDRRNDGSPILVANDLIFGNFGDDTIDTTRLASVGTDQIFGGMGNDSIAAGAQVNDLILGNEGADTILAVSVYGNSTFYGGQGDDFIIVGGAFSVGNDLVYGGEGDDFISVSGGGSNTVYGDVDSVGSGSGSNFIDISGVTSRAGSTSVLQERVYGGSGMDAVSVGAATDAVTITGGAGADQFGYQASASSTTVLGGSGSGLDVVTDFISGTDKFYLQASTANAGAKLTINSVFSAGVQDGQSNLTAAANAAEVTASIQGTNAATFSFQGSYYLVVNGDASGAFTSGNDILINIAGTTSLTKNDFL